MFKYFINIIIIFVHKIHISKNVSYDKCLTQNVSKLQNNRPCGRIYLLNKYKDNYQIKVIVRPNFEAFLYF